MNRTEQNLIVSFCIPLYNSAETTLELVNGLLDTEETRFEVVVSDDASKDKSQEILSQIQDKRFRYFRNERNLGAHKNWEHSLELGRGEWLYLSMGRETLHGDKISKLIELLARAREENVVIIDDRFYFYQPNIEGLKTYDGIDAMINFISVDHPTGLVFKGDIFRTIPMRLKALRMTIH